MRYVYAQNNSGGRFIGPRSITVEADTVEQADKLAIAQGVYFDGVAKGLDCECCGDRWYREITVEGEQV